MVDRAGQRLGNYRLIQLLGRGGFAEVYLSQHLRLNTQAAIKVLHTQLADEDIRHFQAEAQTIANLEHPNIVWLQDFDVQNGTPFLVMQYAPNGSLRTRHPKGTRVPLETVVRYVLQVADALQYAHDQRLVHRDIKPENLLLGRRDEVLLSDFGIALVVQSSRYQSTQEVVGTIAYMAPEQIQGKPRPASDQYALAVVVYEWLSGERPFQGSMSEVGAQHLLTAPPPFAHRVPGLSLAVEEVVLMALAKDPRQRFDSVKSFAAALYQASLLDQSTQIGGSATTFSQPITPQPPPRVSSPLPAASAPSWSNAAPPPRRQSSAWEQAGVSEIQESPHPAVPLKSEPPVKVKHIGRNIVILLLVVGLLVGGWSLVNRITGPNISGTWIETPGSDYSNSTNTLTQSGSSITGNGYTGGFQISTFTITGTINGSSVTLNKDYGNNCTVVYTLTLSADDQSMSGDATGCNASFSPRLDRQQSRAPSPALEARLGEVQPVPLALVAPVAYPLARRGRVERS